MARLFGRILSSIWDDEDFLGLTATEQRMYMFLCSQPNLNHAGLLPLTFRRWSDSAKDLTAEEIRRDLISLEAKRFVVLDFDKEEVLVRSLLRRDDVWKAPRVMGAAVSNAMEIRSRKLRAALLAEVDRLPLDELSDKPGKDNGPSIRQQVEGHIENLRRAYGPLPVPPPQPPGQPLPEEGGDLLHLPVGEPDGEGLYARARGIAGAHASLSPSLSLDGFSDPSSTAPADSDALFGLPDAPPPGGAAGKPQPKGSKRSKPKSETSSSRGTRIPEDFGITESMREWGSKHAPHVNGREATEEFIDFWRGVPGAKGVKLDWPATWRNRMRELEKRAVSGNVIPFQRRGSQHKAYAESEDRHYGSLASAFDPSGA
jgi:hypothetical protein